MYKQLCADVLPKNSIAPDAATLPARPWLTGPGLLPALMRPQYTESVENRSVECSHCGAPLAEGHSGPCPGCGREGGKTIHLRETEQLPTKDFVEARGIPQGRGRSAYFQRSQQGQEIFRKTGRPCRVERVVDKRNNRYYEHIEDAETGEVIRHKDEPLDEHTAERDLRRKRCDGS